VPKVFNVIPITFRDKFELGKFLHAVPVISACSAVGIQNMYVQFVKEML
jgi:hypothetical protein